MKSIRKPNLIAVAASLVFLAAGCGSSGGGSTTTTTTSASATETWASGVCSSITTWQAAITSAAGSLKSDPTKNGLQAATGDAKSATETLSSDDLKGLGKPDTPSGQLAKDSLDKLSANLQQDVATIESAVKGVSGVSGALAVASTVTGTFATMRTLVKTTFTDLQGLDAKGELKTAFTNSSACSSLTG